MTKKDWRVVGPGDHSVELKNLVSKAQDRIDIISPWMMSTTFERIFSSVSEDVYFFVIFRWPQEDEDEGFYDIDLLETLLRKRVDINWISPETPLHAKVYHVRKAGAIITSANLTEMGFPKKNNALGNIEVGIIIESLSFLDRVVEIVDELPVHKLTESDIKMLKDWKTKQKQWKEKNKKILDDKFKLQKPKRDDNPVESVLQLAQKNKKIKCYIPLSKGFSRKAYSLSLNNKRTEYKVRALISEAQQTPQSGLVKSFHFDIPRRDVFRWKEKDKNRIYGLMLVPVMKNAEGIDEYDEEYAPVAYIPFSDLFSRNNLSITPFIRGNRKKNYIRLYLTQRENNQWFLISTGNNRKEIDAGPYTDSTKSLAKSPLDWVKGK